MLEIRALIKLLLLPPFNQLLLMLVAWFIRKRFARVSAALFWFGFTSLYALSTPILSHCLAQAAEQVEPLPVESISKLNAGAIVVLSGGQQNLAQEFGTSASFSDSLFRLRYGAFLHRETGIPILLAGGKLNENFPVSLAETMQMDLQRSFGLSARWLESESRTTYENAQFSHELLSNEGVDRIILVTTAMHMARAKQLFERAGFDVVAAPTLFSGIGVLSYRNFLPQVWSLDKSYQALHEHLGNLYYFFVKT